MKRQLIILSIFSFLATGVFGCEAHTRYRVLCFLFDGVPVPKGEVPCDGNGRPLTVVGAVGRNIPGAAAGQAQYIQHGPYAARMCEGCHQRQTNKLLMPVTDLCLYCHTLSIRKRLVHGPVASGGCSVCHDAHGSGNPYLLVSASQDFCMYCHQREDVMKNDIHRESMSTGCTICHNPHASNNASLLRDVPGMPDEESPWVKPDQKKKEKKYAKTAKASDQSGADSKPEAEKKIKKKSSNPPAANMKKINSKRKVKWPSLADYI